MRSSCVKKVSKVNFYSFMYRRGTNLEHPLVPTRAYFGAAGISGNEASACKRLTRGLPRPVLLAGVKNLGMIHTEKLCP
jgi:hypothetical protein